MSQLTFIWLLVINCEPPPSNFKPFISGELLHKTSLYSALMYLPLSKNSYLRIYQNRMFFLSKLNFLLGQR